jgi:hypothetical protein
MFGARSRWPTVPATLTAPSDPAVTEAADYSAAVPATAFSPAPNVPVPAVRPALAVTTAADPGSPLEAEESRWPQFLMAASILVSSAAAAPPADTLKAEHLLKVLTAEKPSAYVHLEFAVFSCRSLEKLIMYR